MGVWKQLSILASEGNTEAARALENLKAGADNEKQADDERLRNGRLGNGKVIHLFREGFTACGSDHQTNTGPRRKTLSDYNPAKITCRKCRTRLKEAK